MITVRKEWQYKMGSLNATQELIKEYKATFDPSPACRIFQGASGMFNHFVIEDDYESFADYEVKWSERTNTPEFQTWVEKWASLTADATFEFNFYRSVD